MSDSYDCDVESASPSQVESKTPLLMDGYKLVTSPQDDASGKPNEISIHRSSHIWVIVLACYSVIISFVYLIPLFT